VSQCGAELLKDMLQETMKGLESELDKARHSFSCKNSVENDSKIDEFYKGL